MECVIPAAVVVPPTRIFEDISVDLEVCKADSRCIWWVFDYTTDTDVIFSTARFAADMIWYPEIAGVVSPHVLANLFFDCLLNGRVIPGKSEHASAIGMALASVLSARLTAEPESQMLGELCHRIRERIPDVFPSDPICLLVADVLVAVTKPVAQKRRKLVRSSDMDRLVFGHLPTTEKIWFSLVMLQIF